MYGTNRIPGNADRMAGRLTTAVLALWLWLRRVVHGIIWCGTSAVWRSSLEENRLWSTMLPTMALLLSSVWVIGRTHVIVTHNIRHTFNIVCGTLQQRSSWGSGKVAGSLSLDTYLSTLSSAIITPLWRDCRITAIAAGDRVSQLLCGAQVCERELGTACAHELTFREEWDKFVGVRERPSDKD